MKGLFNFYFLFAVFHVTRIYLVYWTLFNHIQLKYGSGSSIKSLIKPVGIFMFQTHMYTYYVRMYTLTIFFIMMWCKNMHVPLFDTLYNVHTALLIYNFLFFFKFHKNKLWMSKSLYTMYTINCRPIHKCCY